MLGVDRDGWFQRWQLPSVLACAAIGIALVPELADRLLRYDRVAIGNNEWWRMLTAHLVHLNQVHLGLNLAGLLLIWVLFGHALSSRQWWLVAGLSAIAVGVGLLLRNPELVWYVGMSGVLHGLLFGGALALARGGDRLAIIVLVASVGKLAYEQMTGSGATDALVGGMVVVDAHLYGAAGGLIALVMPRPGGARSGGKVI